MKLSKCNPHTNTPVKALFGFNNPSLRIDKALSLGFSRLDIAWIDKYNKDAVAICCCECEKRFS